ncbi:MAG: phytanoyl-CoA dioxygenase family protein [Armatimonadetes bacterium]|nr:phytanoyl-CoA dioxygenase family protein [Armatimonadota bacterium]
MALTDERLHDRGRLCISDEEKQAFLDNGFLVLKNVLSAEELKQMRQAMDSLMAPATHHVLDDPDYFYSPGHKTGRKVLNRIEYVIDKTEPAKALLGHPFILRSVEKIMGPDLIPTWDSMVLKMPGEGIVVPWHRDAGVEQQGDTPIFNVDFYLDDADLDTCLWAYPGSQRWPQEDIDAIVRREGFATEGATPIPMEAGDVLFHNILVLHGSPPNSSDKLRRVVYYEFRTAHTENEIGPHAPSYIPLKQKVLMRCLEKRAACEYAGEEEAFVYQPPAPWNVNWTPGEELATYRYPHAQYWRNQ